MCSRRLRLNQTTVEDILNLLRHFSQTIFSINDHFSARFFAILRRLFDSAPIVRPALLKLCIDKLAPFLQPLPSTGNSVQTQEIPLLQRLEELCVGGRFQQPFHHLMATVALLLYPSKNSLVVVKEEPRGSELSSLVNQLVELLINVEPGEFHLDKGTVFDGSTEGQTNLCKRMLLTSLYLTVVYVRIAGIEKIRLDGKVDPAVVVLMIGQVATVLENVAVPFEEKDDY